MNFYHEMTLKSIKVQPTKILINYNLKSFPIFATVFQNTRFYLFVIKKYVIIKYDKVLYDHFFFYIFY